MTDERIDITALCEILGCSDNTVRKLVKAGRLPKPVRWGRKNVWFKSSIAVAITAAKVAAEKNIKKREIAAAAS